MRTSRSEVVTVVEKRNIANQKTARSMRDAICNTVVINYVCSDSDSHYVNKIFLRQKGFEP